MKTITQKQERIADVADALGAGLVLAVMLTLAEAAWQPARAVPPAVALEGLVVTPQRVYSASEWAQAKAAAGERLAWSARPQVTGAHCQT